MAYYMSIHYRMILLKYAELSKSQRSGPDSIECEFRRVGLFAHNGFTSVVDTVVP